MAAPALMGCLERKLNKRQNLEALMQAEQKYFDDTLTMWPKSSEEDRKKRLAEVRKRLENRQNVLQRGILSLKQDYLDFLQKGIQHLNALSNILLIKPITQEDIKKK